MRRSISIFFTLVFIHFSILGQAQQQFRFPKGFSSDQYLPHTIVYKLKGEPYVSKSNRRAHPQQELSEKVLARLGASSNEPLFGADHFIFHYTAPEKIGQKTKRLSLIRVLKIAPSQDLEKAINVVLQDPVTDYAEPVYTHAPMRNVNDPLAAGNQQYHLTRINAFDAWDFETGDPSMIIGIVDNGTNVNNSDLNANYHAPVFFDNPFDLLNDISGASTNNIFDSDDNVVGGSHGEDVALCAAAVPNNNVGTVGTGFNCSFLPVKVAPDDNLNNYIDGYGGILYAAKQGCKVINLSWGRNGPPSSLEIDILGAVYQDDDVVIIAAAGNDNNEELFYPASYGFVLSVAATDENDQKSDFSSFNSRVDLSAPGSDIVVENSSIVSGTSFAAPLVAGTAGLIRVQHPTWNASQVMARLKTTADQIYDDPINQEFRGKLGTGRLNMLRALSDSLKAITLDSCTFDPMSPEGYLINGSTATMNLFICNHLNALSNLSVKVRSESPYIHVLDSTSSLGAITENARFDTQVDAFRLKIDENTPANTVGRLIIEYTDNNYVYEEDYTVLLNPGNVSNNLLELAVNDDGQVAVYNNAFSPVHGLRYFGQRLVKEAGFMIGIEDASGNFKVSDAVRFDLNSRNQDFTLVDVLTKSENGTQLSSEASFEDITNNSDRIGVEIKQRTFSWSNNDLSSAVILEYQVTNLSANAESIDKPHMGLFVNWDINNAEQNTSQWDADRNMGYAFDRETTNLYGGLVLLTDRPDRLNRETPFVSYYTFDTDNFASSVNIFDGFSTTEKYRALSSELLQTEAGQSGNGSDIFQLLGSRFDRLEIGETRSIAFAFVVGQSLEEIQTHADRIRNQFITIKTSPIPDVENITTCVNANVIIAPGNGSTFNFYLSPPIDNSVSPIFTGSSLNVNNIMADQNYYVTSLDSIYESDFVEVQVQVARVVADFEPNKSEVDISLENSLSLQNNSQNANGFSWEFSRNGGAPNADVVYLNGTQANSESPQVSFNAPGTYRIKLISSSTENCLDSLTTTFEVVQSVTTGISSFLQRNLSISPNPTADVLNISLPDFSSDIRVEIINTFGKVVQETSLSTSQSGDHKISVQQLPAGVYHLKAYEGQEYYSLRFVKL